MADLHMQLLDAVHKEDINAFVKALSQGAFLDATDMEGNTALHHACIKGLSDYVRPLLDHGANPNLANEAGNTPLHYACRYGHPEVANDLLEHRARVDAKNELGETPLHWACTNGHPSVVRPLLGYAADVHACDNAGNKPLDKLLPDRYKGHYHAQTALLLCSVMRHKVTEPYAGQTLTEWFSNGGRGIETIQSAVERQKERDLESGLAGLSGIAGSPADVTYRPKISQPAVKSQGLTM